MPCLLLEDARKPLAIRTRLCRSVPDEDERAAGGRGEGAHCSSTASAAARSRLGPVCAPLGCRPRLRGETAGRAGAQVTRGLHTPRRACRHVCVALCWSSSPNKPACPRRGAWESNVPASGGACQSDSAGEGCRSRTSRLTTALAFPGRLRQAAGPGWGPRQPGVWTMPSPVPTPVAGQWLCSTGLC